MGKWADATRAEIAETLEAGSGDMQGELEPVLIWRRAGGDRAIALDKTMAGELMQLAYTIQDGALDDDDVERIFVVAYLDVLTDSYYDDKVATLEMRNKVTGYELAFNLER